MKIQERSWTGPHLELRNALRRIEAGTVTAKPIIGRDLRLSLSKLAVLDRPCRALAGRPVHRKAVTYLQDQLSTSRRPSTRWKRTLKDSLVFVA